MKHSFPSVVLGACFAISSYAAEQTADPQSLLTQKCLSCHNERAKAGGLSLSTSSAMRQGGKRGPAVVPGKPDESVLFKLISDGQPRMPLGGQPLTSAEVLTIRHWIEQGAAWKNPEDWWSLRPLTRVPAHSTIDSLVEAKLKEQDLLPSAEADRRTLLRRLTYDLNGLPPSQEEVNAFVSDKSPNAYEKVVDRLLASPRYGERWGRHWLDVVHYGETHGYDKDKPRRNAWPYRDYVIRAFNEDKPYRRFVQEQLAGDMLWPNNPEATVALGFIAAGPWDFVGQVELREGTTDKNITRVLDRDDMVTATMSAFVSMTAHCARCHDHKFDPIRQEDYYNLQSVFAGVDRADRPYDDDPAVFVKRNVLMAKLRVAVSALRPSEEAAAAVTTPEITQLDQQVSKLKELNADNPALRPPSIKKEIAEAETKRKALVRSAMPPVLVAEADRLTAEVAAIHAEIETLPKPHLVYAAANYFDPQGTFRFAPAPRPVNLLLRGSVETPGPASVPGTISCVPGLKAHFEVDPNAPEGARRVALANWITDEQNPLTWRSIVNRMWHYHFGTGIVDSLNDFGHMGSQPSNPELLDFLAADFRDSGGSFKRLHKMIVMSKTYRQVSTGNPQGDKLDGENRYFWRANRQRLDAESLRDTVLAVSGKLDLTVGGPSVEQFFFKDDHSPVYDYARFDPDAPANFRRSVYRFLVRSVPDPLMERFDCPDISMVTAKRNTTITAIQALALLNNPFILKQTEHFAERVKAAATSPAGQIEAAYRMAFERAPTPKERDALIGYLGQHGLVNFCRLIVNTNEFLFVD